MNSTPIPLSSFLEEGAYVGSLYDFIDANEITQIESKAKDIHKYVESDRESILSCVYFTNAWDKVSIKKVPQYSKYLEDKIYLLIEKNLFLNHKFEPKNIIYEGPYLMVIDSGYQVKDSLEGDLFDFSKINGRNIIANLNINHILPNSIFKE